MSVTAIKYEVVTVDATPEALSEALNTLGAQGFGLHHTHVQDGKYTLILSKDTGRLPDEATSSTEWVDDGFVNEETSWT